MSTDAEDFTNWPITKRRKLPDTRPSTTVRFNHCGWKGYLIVGFYPDTDQPGEVFIVIAKEGTFTACALDMIARQASYLLQQGIPGDWLVQHWRHHIVDPMGPVTKKGCPPYEGSLFDAIAEAFLEACNHYGDANPELDHLKRKVQRSERPELVATGSDERERSEVRRLGNGGSGSSSGE